MDTEKFLFGGMTGLIIGLCLAGSFLVAVDSLLAFVFSPVVIVMAIAGLITGWINNRSAKLYAHILWGMAVSILAFSFICVPAMWKFGLFISSVSGLIIGIATFYAHPPHK